MGRQVNYVGKAANLYEDAGYKLSGASYVVNKFLGTTWLWDRVRVVGGAYGGFSDFDSHSGEPGAWQVDALIRHIKPVNIVSARVLL